MSTARRELAERQAALLAALLGQGPAPAGVDPARVEAQGRALVAKRARVVQRQLPRELVDATGDRFGALFGDYAVAHPRRTGTSAHDDAVAFRRWLADHGVTMPRRGLRAWFGR